MNNEREFAVTGLDLSSTCSDASGFLVLTLMPSTGESQVAGNNAFALLEPLNGAVFAPQIAPTFHWQSSQYTLFQVQFSADLTFPAGETVSIPAGETLTSDVSLVPEQQDWQAIQALEEERQIVHWRVVGHDAQGNTVFSEVRSFFVTANPPLNNKLVNVVDVSFPGRGLSTQIARTYLIDSTYSGPFGLRWTHSYNMSLQEFPDGLVKIFNPDGTESFFKPIEGGGYEALPGDFRILTQNVDGSFVLRGKFGLLFHFDADGKLAAIVEPNSNQITLGYNARGLLDTLADPAGR